MYFVTEFSAVLCCLRLEARRDGNADIPRRFAPYIAEHLLTLNGTVEYFCRLRYAFPLPQMLAAANATRAASLHRNDWYRLSRSLEVRESIA